LEADTKVNWFLETPTIDRQKKQQAVDIILQKGKYQPTTINLLNVLVENGRLGETRKIISAYNQLMVATRGEVSVVVTSAKVLLSIYIGIGSKNFDKNQRFPCQKSIGRSRKEIVDYQQGITFGNLGQSSHYWWTSR
jgi:hypothetical protein